MKNKWAEGSIRTLQGRIMRLEFERNDYEAYLKSDKAMYLATLELIIGMLMALAAGDGFSWVMNDLNTTGHYRIFSHATAFLFYGVTFVLGVKATAISSHQRREKIILTIAKLDEEIKKLQSKLAKMSKI